MGRRRDGGVADRLGRLGSRRAGAHRARRTRVVAALTGPKSAWRRHRVSAATGALPVAPVAGGLDRGARPAGGHWHLAGPAGSVTLTADAATPVAWEVGMDAEEVSEISEPDAGVEDETVYDESIQPVWQNLG